MEFKEAVKLALQSLWANKLRSVLTLLGVVIGVASVIAVVTLVNGANRYVADKIYRYGADVFTVSKQSRVITSYDEYMKFQKRKNVLLEDERFIADNCKRCQSVGALQNTAGKVVVGTHSTHGHRHPRMDLDHAAHVQPERGAGARFCSQR
jgi:putative ABC transport system permease protein